MKKKLLDEKSATPDVLWKEIIHKFFKEFVLFFKPDLYPHVLFEKTEFMDKELNSITSQKVKGVVDILAKIFLRNGDFGFIFFHVEIQGYNRIDFPKWMFSYFCRIWDMCQTPVLSLAIFTSGSAAKSTCDTFEFSVFGTEIKYRFNTFDVNELDYEKCLRSENRVETALGILASTPGKPLWQKKLEVLKSISRFSSSPEEFHLWFSFVDRLSPLKPNEVQEFRKQIVEHEKEITMILTSFEEKAMEEGIRKGVNKGVEKGKMDSLFKIVKSKFGSLPDSLKSQLIKISKIRKTDELIENAIHAENLEAFLAVLDKKQPN